MEYFLSKNHQKLVKELTLYLIVRQVKDVDVGNMGEGLVANGGDPVAGYPEAVEATEAGEVVVPDLRDGVVALQV